MSTTVWNVRVTISSSNKARAEELARDDSRSAANYVRSLIDKDVREKEPAR